MIETTVSIAGCAFAVRTLYQENEVLLREYQTDEPALFTIESSKSKIDNERQLLKAHIESDKQSVIRFSDSQIESNYLYRETAEQLSKYGVVLLHGSAIAVDGEAYIFVAPSGTGKSTHTRLWRKVFGNRAVMINDDKPLLKCTDKGIFVYGSPWNGKHKLGCNASVPLKAICFLRRGEENRIIKISDKEAFLPLLKAVYHSKMAEREACILQSLQCIRQMTAFYKLECNMEQNAAIVAYEGMNDGQKK